MVPEDERSEKLEACRLSLPGPRNQARQQGDRIDVKLACAGDDEGHETFDVGRVFRRFLSSSGCEGIRAHQSHVSAGDVDMYQSFWGADLKIRSGP